MSRLTQIKRYGLETSMKCQESENTPSVVLVNRCMRSSAGVEMSRVGKHPQRVNLSPTAVPDRAGERVRKNTPFVTSSPPPFRRLDHPANPLRAHPRMSVCGSKD